ncbi:hypothetical protein [Acinetobacter sp. c3-l95]|uniref:hypothetical protein n=1 Tax=Acinetobacter sp. c3-l95 TaxID=3342804 RepID=UPI0035B785BD
MTEQLIVTGDILKSEADIKSRISIPAPVGTKIGDVVKYPLRNQYLIALSDEQYGTVSVQPQNCVIDLSKITLPSNVLQTDLVKQGDAHGIQYQGTATQGKAKATQALDPATTIAIPTSSGAIGN